MVPRSPSPGSAAAEEVVATDYVRLLEDIQAAPGAESVQVLLESQHVRIERIVSRGYQSPPGFWYDQAHDEWVVVIAGCGVVTFDDDREIRMTPGDSVYLPARCRHRISYTDPDVPTVWLAVRIDAD